MITWRSDADFDGAVLDKVTRIVGDVRSRNNSVLQWYLNDASPQQRDARESQQKEELQEPHFLARFISEDFSEKWFKAKERSRIHSVRLNVFLSGTVLLTGP